jgi:hypothetical protein
MVTFRGRSKFYARGANGKYEMNVQQIREAFVAAESLREAVRNFRSERLAGVMSGEASPTTTFYRPAQIVLHVIPVSTFNAAGPRQTTFDFSELRPGNWKGGPHKYRRFNFDGLLCWTNAKDGKCAHYVQVFRDGTIEVVDAIMLQPEGMTIPGTSFEKQTIYTVGYYLRDLARCGVGGPFLIMLSLVNVRGYRMATAVDEWGQSAPIDRDMLVVPELWLDDAVTEDKIPGLLQGTLEVVWQSAGWEVSPNYTPDGVWHG